MLVYFHSVKANMMQTVIGNTLFTASAHHSVHATLSRIGIATTYNSTIGQLHSLGLDKKATLKTLGCAIVTGKVQVHLLYDNINQYHCTWSVMDRASGIGVHTHRSIAMLGAMRVGRSMAFQMRLGKIGRAHV